MARTSRKTLIEDARAAARSCAGSSARLSARRITRFLEARMVAAGVSLSQFGLMTHIAAAEDDRIGALAERMGLDQSTLSRNLRALERAGLVEIAIVEKDLRRRAVWLTETGARRLETAIPLWREANAALAERVDLRPVWSMAAATAVLEPGTSAASSSS